MDRRGFLINGSLALAAASKCIPNRNPQGLKDRAHCAPWLIGGAVSYAEILNDAPLATSVATGRNSHPGGAFSSSPAIPRANR